MNKFIKADKFNECHLLDISIVKVIWQFVSAGGQKKKSGGGEETAAKGNMSRQSWKQSDGEGAWRRV